MRKVAGCYWEEREMDSETTEKAETKKMSPRTRFWVLFTLWTIFACVVPVCFIA